MPARNRDTGTYGHPHRKRRAQLLAAMRDGDPCARCNRPMYRDQALHADHVSTPRVLAPGTQPDALSHKHCNLSHGAKLGNRMRGQRRAAARRPSRELPVQPRTSRRW